MKSFIAFIILAVFFVYKIDCDLTPVYFNGTHFLVNNSTNRTNNNTYPNYFNNTRNNTIFPNNFNGTTKDGHLLIGTISTYDRLLFNQEYFKDSRWWSSREKEIEYPKDLTGYNRHETITAIRVYNKFYHGNSARASIVKGGVGYQYVKIRLESKFGKGFRFLVQLFGR